MAPNSWDEKRDFTVSAKHAARRTLDFLRPAIITRAGPQKKIARTAYLDGLRGFAAFLVYWQHHQLWPLRPIPSTRIMENGWGYEGKYYFAALPFIRTIFTGGHFAVAVFFVISAYVLSLKPLTMIHAGETSRLGENLASALFRRWIRLHLPIILVVVPYFTSWHLFGLWTSAPEHEKNFRDEAWKFYLEFKSFSFVFRSGGDGWISYNFPVWSIPVEFRGSIIIFTALLAFSRATRNARLWCEVGLIYYFLYIVDGWFGALFCSGMLLCDLDLLAKDDNLPNFITRFSRYKTPFFYTLFFLAMVLSGVPSHIADSVIMRDAPGWRWVASWNPQAVFDHKWFFLFWAANFLVACIPRIGWLKAFFETSFNQYLGRISFALYLVHGPVIWTLGDRLYAAVGYYKEIHEQNIPEWINAFPISKSGPLGLEPAFLVPHLILLPVTLWLAEIVTKICDEPSNTFAHWFYQKTLPPVQPTLNGELHG